MGSTILNRRVVMRASIRSICLVRALSHRRTELAARTSAPSRIMSSQFGQTRTVPRPVGANTRTYRSVTNELQLSQRAIPENTIRRVNGVRHGQQRTLSSVRDVELTATAGLVGERVGNDIGDSVCTEAVDDVEQTDSEWGQGRPRDLRTGVGITGHRLIPAIPRHWRWRVSTSMTRRRDGLAGRRLSEPGSSRWIVHLVCQGQSVQRAEAMTPLPWLSHQSSARWSRSLSLS